MRAETQLAIFLLLITAGLPVIRLLATPRRVGLGLSVLMGVAGLTFTGSCLILSRYVAGLELLGRTIPLLGGFWAASVGCVILGIAATILIWQSGQRYLLAAVLLLPVVWTAYFAHLLGMV